MVLACRDLCKAKEAAEEISKETGNKVATLQLDLASLSSVRAAAEELKTLQNSHSRQQCGSVAYIINYGKHKFKSNHNIKRIIIFF